MPARATRWNGDGLRGIPCRIRPGQPVAGRPERNEFWAHDAEGILVHILAELCHHLGQLEVTRNLITST